MQVTRGKERGHIEEGGPTRELPSGPDAWLPDGNALAIGGAQGLDVREVRIFAFLGTSLLEVASLDYGTAVLSARVGLGRDRYQEGVVPANWREIL